MVLTIRCIECGSVLIRENYEKAEGAGVFCRQCGNTVSELEVLALGLCRLSGNDREALRILEARWNDVLIDEAADEIFEVSNA